MLNCLPKYGCLGDVKFRKTYRGILLPDKFGKVANAKNIKITYGMNLSLPPSTVVNTVKRIWTDKMRSQKYLPLFIKYFTCKGFE